MHINLQIIVVGKQASRRLCGKKRDKVDGCVATAVAAATAAAAAADGHRENDASSQISQDTTCAVLNCPFYILSFCSNFVDKPSIPIPSPTLQLADEQYLKKKEN
ncbi:hypothetical protein T12_11875 [Trichinella patagoniensis]|uniref:Uncharacterized protein n=1 Tax=Trichinella patagoniensis TaxID=990121 RepID=A0A0V1AEK8_9BILA|nr:hypothetical protein T12_11875 [Trichinella patagoniensis]